MNKLIKIELLFFITLLFTSCHQAEEKINYYPNGQIKEICSYRNGILDGKQLYYYETGVLFGEGRTRNNKMIGEWRYYYPDGKIMTIEKHNRHGELLSIDSWDQNGNQVIVNGTGTLVIYYPDGSIKQTTTYKNCHFDGANESWYPNGVKEHEIFYKDGKPCGVWNFWDENGELENTENHEE